MKGKERPDIHVIPRRVKGTLDGTIRIDSTGITVDANSAHGKLTIDLTALDLDAVTNTKEKHNALHS